jgi:hypothetical protein
LDDWDVTGDKFDWRGSTFVKLKACVISIVEMNMIFVIQGYIFAYIIVHLSETLSWINLLQHIIQFIPIYQIYLHAQTK